jgi:hypothetical protein
LPAPSFESNRSRSYTSKISLSQERRIALYEFTWVPNGREQTETSVRTQLDRNENEEFVPFAIVRVDDDARNTRSRNAIAGIGASFEGVLRQFGPSWAPGESGMLRDSAMFSVVAAEWPAIEIRLRERVRCFAYRD